MGTNLEYQLVIFETQDKEISLNVRVKDDTVWLNRQQMFELFGRDIKTIGKHISNALTEEMDQATVAKFATVQNEGGRKVTRNIEYYNLDMVLSVGYRVKSKRGIEFRRWANNVLKQYILKVMQSTKNGCRSYRKLWKFRAGCWRIPFRLMRKRCCELSAHIWKR